MNLQQARDNMVDCQINTMGVVSPAVLDVFSNTPRELFVCEGCEGIAYCDEDIPLGNGRFLMAPAVHARMLQAAAPVPGDVVLDIGGATGYSAALLSNLVITVFALECDSELLDKANKAWEELAVCNIASFNSPLELGCPEHSPYDLIFLNGAVSQVPEALKAQLAEGGRLVAVIRKPGELIGKATLIEHVKNNIFAERILFEAGTKYLPGFGTSESHFFF